MKLLANEKREVDQNKAIRDNARLRTSNDRVSDNNDVRNPVFTSTGIT